MLVATAGVTCHVLMACLAMCRWRACTCGAFCTQRLSRFAHLTHAVASMQVPVALHQLSTSQAIAALERGLSDEAGFVNPVPTTARDSTASAAKRPRTVQALAPEDVSTELLAAALEGKSPADVVPVSASQTRGAAAANCMPEGIRAKRSLPHADLTAGANVGPSAIKAVRLRDVSQPRMPSSNQAIHRAVPAPVDAPDQHQSSNEYSDSQEHSQTVQCAHSPYPETVLGPAVDLSPQSKHKPSTGALAAPGLPQDHNDHLGPHVREKRKLFPATVEVQTTGTHRTDALQQRADQAWALSIDELTAALEAGS